jgi:predicted dehydrogenase
MKTIKWGILGLGKIAHYFVEDLLNVDQAELYAVASRSQSKADAFSNVFNAKKAYGNYEDLYKDEDVDIIYIATPHAFHFENTMAAINAGKAVLCEKPMALSHDQVKQMVNLARQKKVFLMEAIWTNFMPHLEKTVDITAQKAFGVLKHISAEFCFKASYNPEGRLFNPDLGGGSLLDIGIYPVYLCLKLLGVPDKISATQVKADTGVDLETAIEFTYKNGSSAKLLSSFGKTKPSAALLKYEYAEVKLHSRFHETDQMQITSNGKTELFDFKHQHRGYNFEIANVQECLNNGLKESPKLPLDFSLDLIKLLDDIKRIAESNPHE